MGLLKFFETFKLFNLNVSNNSSLKSSDDPRKSIHTDSPKSNHSVKENIRTFSNSAQVIKNAENWKKLTYLFSTDEAKKIISDFNDPLVRQKNYEECQKSIFEIFEQIQFASHDPRTQDFNVIKEQTFRILNGYLESQDETSFLRDWLEISVRLKEIYKKGNFLKSF